MAGEVAPEGSLCRGRVYVLSTNNACLSKYMCRFTIVSCNSVVQVFVKTSASDVVMVVIRPAGSVVELKRAIRDAKDKAYRFKFGELIGYYPHFSSGNLELNGETLRNTYSLEQVG